MHSVVPILNNAFWCWKSFWETFTVIFIAMQMKQKFCVKIMILIINLNLEYDNFSMKLLILLSLLIQNLKNSKIECRCCWWFKVLLFFSSLMLQLLFINFRIKLNLSKFIFGIETILFQKTFILHWGLELNLHDGERKIYSTSRSCHFPLETKLMPWMVVVKSLIVICFWVTK